MSLTSFVVSTEGRNCDRNRNISTHFIYQ